MSNPDYNLHRKSFLLVSVVLLVHILLVSTHRGEFWPFSIYPMFSQAGKPWSKALVRDVQQVSDSLLWQTTERNPVGRAVALDDYGINQNDLSNFITKTETWSPRHLVGIRDIIGHQNPGTDRWLIYRVTGNLSADSVQIKMTPFLLVLADTILFNPQLTPSIKPETNGTSTF